MFFNADINPLSVNRDYSSRNLLCCYLFKRAPEQELF